MTTAVLGVDVGTFETKAVLVGDDGTALARAQRGHGISTPAPGQVEQDADAVWWADLVEVARELTGWAQRHAITIDGVGCSGIGPCVLPVDDRLRPLRPAILYGVDTRADREIGEIVAALGTDEIRRRCGNGLTSQSAGPKIAWLSRHEPDVARRTRCYLTSQSYLVARLTGELVIDHGTAGYFHPLYELSTGRWETAGCQGFVREDQLPRLAWANEIAGRVTPEAAAATGLPAGVPVVVGTADAPAEAVGSSVTSPGDMMVMCGSTTYIVAVNDHPEPDPVLWTAPFVFPGTYVSAAGTSTAGTSTRWVADLLGLDSARGDRAMFAELVQLAEQSAPGAGGTVFLPYLSGERTPIHDSGARGVWAGLSLASGRAELARAVIEGVAHSMAHALSAYDAAGIVPKRVIAVGGGTRNPLLLQTAADLTGLTLTVAATDGAAYGDAGIAAIALGKVERREVDSWIDLSMTVEPAPAGSAEREATLARHADYLLLGEQTLPWNHRGERR